MSRSSRRNRANRERVQQQVPGATSRGSARPSRTPAEVISDGVYFSSGPRKSRGLLILCAQELVELDHCGRSEARSTIATMLDRTTDVIVESGWQPAEIVHAGRRVLDQPAQRLLLALISGHAVRWLASTRAPEAWMTQLTDLGATGSGPCEVEDWETTERLDALGVWVAALSALGFLTRLPPLARLIPVPSAWSTTTAARRGARTARPADAKVLATIRGLLAKAESTSFVAEAEALSAKAQDLMTRHAIDSAMVESPDARTVSSQVATRRVLVDNPYSDTKAALLHAVAQPNGVRAISLDPYGIVTVIGMPVDLDFCELLFTSLLIQASRAMTEPDSHTATRTVSFRRSFLYAFADGVGERLTRARDAAVRDASSRYGSALVPVMDARTEAVDAAFREQFPKTTQSSRSVSNRAGWVAGRVAADRADLSVSSEHLAR